MRVVHISNTPVAGSPGKIVAALNQHTDIQARHIVCQPPENRTRTFAIDIDWSAQRDEALAAIDAADVIHIHQFFSFTEVIGEDLSLRFGGRKVIRQFHSAPSLWAESDPKILERIANESIPHLVIAQCPERFYPHARLVPNIVPIHDPRYMPEPEAEDGLPIVVFSPSGIKSAWKRRWETKGAPQTIALLRRLERAGLCRVQLITGTPHDACLEMKKPAALVVDECVTGNYHQSGLEALSQGKPTIGHLDARAQAQLRELTGASDLPWVDVRLEEAEPVLRELLSDGRLRSEIGQASRRWMETHYDDRILVQHYRRAYLDLFNAPETFNVPRLTYAEQWRATSLQDHVWRQRRRAEMGWLRQTADDLKRKIKRLPPL